MARPKRQLIAPQASIGNQNVNVGDALSIVPQDQNTPEMRRALERVEARKHLVTISDQLAGEPNYVRNYKWQGGSKYYPEDIDALMRFVTKYYPYTKAGTPLLVDEPRTENEIVKCYEKQKILKKLGFRHVVIESDANLDTCLDQLGEM